MPVGGVIGVGALIAQGVDHAGGAAIEELAMVIVIRMRAIGMMAAGIESVVVAEGELVVEGGDPAFGVGEARYYPGGALAAVMVGAVPIDFFVGEFEFALGVGLKLRAYALLVR